MCHCWFKCQCGFRDSYLCPFHVFLIWGLSVQTWFVPCCWRQYGGSEGRNMTTFHKPWRRFMKHDFIKTQEHSTKHSIHTDHVTTVFLLSLITFHKTQKYYNKTQPNIRNATFHKTRQHLKTWQYFTKHNIKKLNFTKHSWILQRRDVSEYIISFHKITLL